MKVILTVLALSLTCLFVSPVVAGHTSSYTYSRSHSYTSSGSSHGSYGAMRTNRRADRRQARRADRQSRRNSFSYGSAGSTGSCPTCGKETVPPPSPTTEAPVTLQPIEKNKISDVST